jgi:hypothetical protein
MIEACESSMFSAAVGCAAPALTGIDTSVRYRVRAIFRDESEWNGAAGTTQVSRVDDMESPPFE